MWPVYACAGRQPRRMRTTASSTATALNCPAGYRSRSVRDGPVNIRRSSTSTGVRKSDNKKVPKTHAAVTAAEPCQEAEYEIQYDGDR